MSARVDVQAVMDVIADCDYIPVSAERLHAARAAIAELIEAASRMLPSDSTYDDDDEARLRAALARAGGSA